jgi:hypothetical protein
MPRIPAGTTGTSAAFHYHSKIFDKNPDRIDAGQIFAYT